MIWSLLKIVLFVLAVAAVSFLVALLAETGSDITIVVSDWEIAASPVTLAVAVILFLAALWLIFFLVGLALAFLHFIAGDETALTRYLNRNRVQRGYEALASGLVALASGDPKLAQAKAARAEKLLRRPELTGIVAAQSAERSGDTDRAVSHYKELLTHDETRLAGISGLLRQKINEGDLPTALKLAEKAFAINPRNEDVQDALLKLQSSEEDWEGAASTLAAKSRYGRMPKDVYNRRNAILSYVIGQEKIAAGNKREGEDLVLSANKDCPALVPAAVAAARIKIENGERRAANRIVRKAWTSGAHPDLAAAFAAIEPDESSAERRSRFVKLLGKLREDPESRMIMAEILIADEDFPEARREIGRLADDDPTVRSLAIMAAIERGSGSDDSIVRGWLTRAVSAPRGKQWICGSCQQVHSVWKPLCQKCEAFDSLEWTATEGDERMHTSSVGMLPLVVAVPELSETGMDSEPEGVEEENAI